MGTRADFYIKKTTDEKPVWVGSIAWDGHPESIDEPVLRATNETEFTNGLKAFFSERNDVTLPERGWPWPWEDSRTTDFSYILMPEGKVMASCFGHPLFDPFSDNDQEDTIKMVDFFPDMSAFKNVRYDKGSGLIIITG